MKVFLSLISLCVILVSCKKEVVGKESVSNSEAISFKGNSTSTDSLYTAVYLPTSTTKQIVKHQYYTLSYNEKFEQAEWVAYELKAAYLKNNDFKRPYFIEDPKVTTGSADWRNYKNSGYDKGHLCPAGDMEFSKNAYNDTFYTSNISPQKKEFNSGIWNRLEQKTRYWAEKYNDIYVVTGGIPKDSDKKIGTEKVAVPKYFYKIIVAKSGNEHKTIAFLVPNEKSDKSIYDFVVPIETLEKMTGIDFFPNLKNLKSSKAF
ncbi:DNA/RNA non-specific endonuclease [Flavobacterium quisquiliarum]|uniref:DNA/RNA non-specific endonuclease n=1 Tax=Flavobacterium quisquiliarum TaxID=1834436 RepID=A0ABV8W7B2_9FLAO|nr:DNA/RNA non-specific endonuclease [Flavobacterium quisquiliarum]MBW1657206.1 DNA/RNA non-specific endonuclease [Flavobacterium quisquiliarum]NWL00491.1 endonuclease [Flavobacterium collinsii]